MVYFYVIFIVVAWPVFWDNLNIQQIIVSQKSILEMVYNLVSWQKQFIEFFFYHDDQFAVPQNYILQYAKNINYK